MLEVVGLQIAVRHVVEHRKMQRIDGVPAVEFVAGVVDQPFGDGEAAGAFPGRGAVAAEGELELVPSGAGFEVGQVEAADVVPLDHIRITFGDDFEKRLNQLLFAHRLLRKPRFPAGRVAQRDDDDLIPRAVGIGEIVSRSGQRLQIEGEPPQFGEAHGAEEAGFRFEQRLL